VEYVSPDMTGYEDLGSYGDWSYVAGYGYVWRPVGLVPGWAPYRFGRWMWVAPWGWTWVADEPWGFAPYHYGRWALAGNAWVWVPGSRIVRPVYAPALVAWVGGAASNRSVGWFPLAPGEVFVPAYKVSNFYVNRVNTTNTSVTEARVSSVYSAVVTSRNTGSNFTYANRGVDSGITMVSHDTFVNARPVARNVVAVSAKENASSPVTQTAAIEPSPLSRLGAGASAHQAPAAVTNRAVVARRTPSPAAQPSLGQPLAQRSLQPSSSPSLVRQLAPGQPVSPSAVKRSSTSDPAFKSFEPGSSSNVEQVKPHVWEEQGTPQSDTTTQRQAPTRNSSSAQQRPHTTAKSTAPAPAKPAAQPEKEEEPKYSSWHPEKSPANSQPQSVSHSATQSHSSSSSSPPPPPKK
jgi:hypothetical protein